MPHREHVPLTLAGIGYIAHDLADKMNSHSAGTPLAQWRVNIRPRGLGKVKGSALVGEDHLEGAVGFHAHPYSCGVRHAVASAVADGVDKQFFQDEVQLKLDLGGKGMVQAKTFHLARQAGKLVNIAG